MKKMNTQSGNVMIFILIAIGLLGLLTVSLSKSSSDSNDTGSYEQSQIASSEILTSAKSIETAVQSLLARGCSENEISFENNKVTGYENPNSPSDKSCHVFDVAGAGVTYTAPNEKWLESEASYYTFVKRHCVENIGKMSSDCNNTDLDLLFLFGFLKKDICLSINDINSIPNISNDAPSKNVSGSDFIGSFVDTNKIIFDGEFSGKPTGCVKDALGPTSR